MKKKVKVVKIDFNEDPSPFRKKGGGRAISINSKNGMTDKEIIEKMLSLSKY